MSRSGAGAAAHREATGNAPTWTEVDLAAIRHNLRLIAAAARTRVLAVVKADAYGHGVERVARAALEAGAWGLGIARVREGVQLRALGIHAPVLVFGYAAGDDLESAVANDLALSVWDAETARELSAIAGRLGRRARVHLKVDTGMRRYGVEPRDAVRYARLLSDLPSVEIEGAYTHLATADEPAGSALAKQSAAFRDVVGALGDAGLRPPLMHAANSAAALSAPHLAYDAVRPGLALYGAQPVPGRSYDLRPAMSLRARVSRMLDVPRGDGVSYGLTWRAAATTRAAVVACGYADGYSRLLSNRGDVLIGGRRCRVLGRVCMDAVVVGLPEGLEARVGDEAVLVGRQGPECVGAEELADRSGLSAYEVLCGLGSRAERLYVG